MITPSSNLAFQFQISPVYKRTNTIIGFVIQNKFKNFDRYLKQEANILKNDLCMQNNFSFFLYLYIYRTGNDKIPKVYFSVQP